MLLLLCLLGLLVLFRFLYSRTINRLRGLPPGPPPLPLIGNILSFEKDMEKKFLKWKEEYGKIYTIWLPKPIVVIGDWKVLQENVVRDGDAYAGRCPPKNIMNLLFGGCLGLILNDNSIWKEQRKFAVHSLAEFGLGKKKMEDVVGNYANQIVEEWRGREDEAVDPAEMIMAGIANVIWNLVYGKTLPLGDPLIREVRRLLDEAQPLTSGPFMILIELFPSIVKWDDWLCGGKIAKIRRLTGGVADIVKKEIEEVENGMVEGEGPQCYVNAFLMEMKRREESGLPLDSFKAALDVWGAGFDATVSNLRFCLHFLVNFPEAQSKMQAEIYRVVGEREIRIENQKELHYCNAFIQEVLRLSNVLPMNLFREVLHETRIEGYSLPAGMRVLPQFQMVHKDSSQFERPDFFCPSRHLDGEGVFIKDHRITPFSVGKRACLGEELARMELFLFLSTFVQHLSFTPEGKVPPAMEFVQGFTRYLKPFNVRIMKRHEA